MLSLMQESTEATERLAHSTRRVLEPAHRALAQQIDRAVADGPTGYWQWPAGIESALAGAGAAPRTTHDDALQRHLDGLLLVLMAGLPDRWSRHGLPAAFAPEYEHTCRRILARISAGRAWPGGATGDIFRKELALLSFRLLPCASHVVSRRSGLPRRL
jgi:hypothetical protein